MNRDSAVTVQNWVVMFGFASSQEDHFLRRCFDAMEVDALDSSHPISTPVEDPAQILEMFDDVSYEKVKHISAVGFTVALRALCGCVSLVSPHM